MPQMEFKTLNSFFALFTFLHKLNTVSAQQFIYRCTDRRLILRANGLSYCDESCLDYADSDTFGCTPSGICLCGFECYNNDVNPGNRMPANAMTFCNLPRPAPAGDPAFNAQCAAACQAECPGGIPRVCGERGELANSPVVARVCHCLCQARSCDAPLTDATTMTCDNTQAAVAAVIATLAVFGKFAAKHFLAYLYLGVNILCIMFLPLIPYLLYIASQILDTISRNYYRPNPVLPDSTNGFIDIQLE